MSTIMLDSKPIPFARIEFVRDRYPQTGVAGCMVSVSGRIGVYLLPNPYADIAGVAVQDPLEVPCIESTDLGKHTCDQTTRALTTINAGDVRDVRGALPGYSTVTFTGGREIVVALNPFDLSPLIDAAT